jgi:predicted ATPase/DNA-binding SARP family transcriptional activator
VVTLTAVEFAVLGPLEVREAGRVLPLRQGRPRALLAALLLRLGRVATADVLVEEVWGGQRLANAPNALQVQVSYVRRALGLGSGPGRPALRTVSGGYLLDVDPGTVDAHRFECLVQSAAARLAAFDAAAALDELRVALELWGGAPYQDLLDAPAAVAEIARLEELRAAALEYQIDARLALGEHDLAVPALRQLIAEHPLRERLRAQLALALYRSGRQAEALRELDATRRLLVEELGVEPGRELQQLHRAVLEQAPELDWSPPAIARVRGSAGPPRTAAAEPAPRSRLPAPTSRLVGREQELARVHDVIAGNRIVTLTGPGGAGKTRLALAVAHAEAARRPVWLVELAEVHDPRVVPYEIADAIGVATEGDPFEALAVGLAGRPGLLVLDTCEHLVDACAHAAHRLLRDCPDLGILATSRQPLAVSGEVAWPVHPLGLPPDAASLDDIKGAEAVRLFHDRARAARPDFDIDETNAANVADICRVLDGLPLAIELAAARIKVLSPAAILARLDDRFALLQKVGPAAEIRQQSLRAAIQWSYDLLDDDHRRFFDRLGAFAGRFSLDAAARVAGDGLPGDALDLLTAVVDRSLVVLAGEDSYRLLDSLRAFAVEQLDAQPSEGAAARGRLAGWLAEFCEARDAHQWGVHDDAVFAEVRGVMPNARAALDWCFTAGDRATGVRLVAALAWFWGAVGANEEAMWWLRRALETPGLDDVARARLLEGMAMHSFASGDMDAGRRVAEEAAELWTRVGAPGRSFAALIYCGLAERARGELATAAATLDRAIAIATRNYSDWAVAVALYWRAAVAADQVDDELARQLLEQALLRADRAGDRRATGAMLHQLGRIALRAGDATRALDLARQALAIHEAVGWKAGLPAAHDAAGRALVASGRPAEAIAEHRRGLQRAMAFGGARAVAKGLEGLAEAYAADGRLEAAAEILGAAGALRESSAVPANPTQQRVVAHIEATLRDALGENGFEAARRRGQRQGPPGVLGAESG